MKNPSVMDKDGVEEEDSLESEGKTTELAEENNLCEGLVTKKDPEHTIILNTRRSASNNVCDKQWFNQKICALDNRIPKYIPSLDEKYLLCCLELMHISAFGAASCNSSSNFSNSFSSRGLNYKNTFDLTRLVIEYPLASFTHSVAIKDSVSVSSSTGDWILGTITASKSMKNILRSPLLHQLGALNSGVNVGRRGLLEDKEAVGSDFISSSSKCLHSTPKKLKDVVLGDHGYESEPMYKRLASLSSTNSTSSDQSSSSVSASVSQGMLKCTWKNGFPSYVFSVDDQCEVYVANLLKIQSPDDKALDYIYTFHSKSDGKRENGVSDIDLNLVGKMKVFTSVTLCPENSEIMETQFVLFGSSHNWSGEMQTSAHTLRKNKGLTKKVTNVFRTRQSRKRRNSSNFGGTSTILEDTSWEPSEDVSSNPDHGQGSLLENCIPTNLELAAIIVKHHLRDDVKEPETGGWGLKFLKKSGIRQIDTPLESLVSSEGCSRDSGECSTSMDILVPAGFHGGPRTRRGGPSSILERWRSGGHCDCGGWDIGCPLTVINTMPSRTESPGRADKAGECKTIDLFVKGSKQIAPIMKMTNIHEDLHYIHFQSTLSALQSFSIAAAIIHSHSPALRPKLYRN